MKRRHFLKRTLLTTIAIIITSKISGCNLAAKSLKGTSKNSGSFTFGVEPIVSGKGEGTAELREKIVALWQDYLRMDTPSFLSHWKSEAIRVSSRSGVRQVGVAAIESGMAAEWSAFERPNNLIAEKMIVKRAEFDIGEDYAIATYWLDIKGGVRWNYSDQGLVFQGFIKEKAEWKLIYQTDAWSLDYDVKSQQPGTKGTLDFDFAYPVNDLDRAVKFYTPLLGEPEYVTSTRASFNIKGGRFILDVNRYDGVAQVKPNLPNGYALFLVEDVQAQYKRLEQADVELLGQPQSIKGDTYCLGLDQDENVFMLWGKNFYNSTDFVPTVSGFPHETDLAKQAEKVMTAWLSMDTSTLNSCLAPQSTWFDDTRLKNRGQERDSNITKSLSSEYWSVYDQGKEGITANLKVERFQSLTLGSYQIVSYDLHLKGQGLHPFQDLAWVTQVFSSDLKLIHTLIVENNHSNTPVLELDYTGYPVQDADQSRRFYDKQLGLGEGYPDEQYYGFWSNHAVFGLYEAKSDASALIQPRKTNGYMSFWVRSVEKIYSYLQEKGTSFPVISAINNYRGIDKQAGYAQLVATDSEGNVIIFTEYSGRPR